MHKEPDDHKTRTTSKKGRNEEKYLLILSALLRTAQRLRPVAYSSILVESLLDS